ncbi:MAG TPA: PHP domain-containing protein [Vicinamibacterales bacterium]|nr:PHP domain-containing protein [Vicinamibacterales bacterium]
MKADLHVHSYHSGYARHFHWLRARECYSTPEDVYRVAKARGMDLVCITDHDSIEGCLEFLERHPDAPDFIAGEEISCLVPDAPGLRVHLGAIGMTESVHREAQRLRDNVFDTAAYLRREGVFCALNHLFMLFDDQMAVESYVRMALTLAPGLETRNGAMLPAHNDFVDELASSLRGAGMSPVGIGGSDAHVLRYVGRTYTEAPGANREEFLANLVEGRTEVGGDHGGRGRLLYEIYGSIANHWGGLLGFKRHEITLAERLASVVCSALLLPFQFVPGLIAFRMKQNEQDRVDRCRRLWAEDVEHAPLVMGSPPR